MILHLVFALRLMGLKKRTDEELLERYRKGNARAFDVLYERYHKKIFNLIGMYLGNFKVAEDLAQDVFVRVVRHRDNFEQKSSFKTYLYRIMRNICIDHLRRMKFRRHLSLNEPVHENEQGAEMVDLVEGTERDGLDTRADSEFMSRFDEVFAELAPEQREVFIMRQLQGMSFKEIAAIVEVPQNTVKSRMRYALEKLRVLLKDFEPAKGA